MRDVSLKPGLFEAAVLDESGSTAIETAVVLPVVLLIVFGVIQFSIALFSYANATYAARAAARYASLHSAASGTEATSTGIAAYVTPMLWNFSPDQYTVTTTWLPANAVGDTVQVSVSLHYRLSIPFAGQQTLSLSNTAARTILR